MENSTLVYKSKWCKAEPIVYTKESDPFYDRFMNKVFSYRYKRAVFDRGRYMYCPSEEWREHFCKIKKVS
jgi:hypothetical protein